MSLKYQNLVLEQSEKLHKKVIAYRKHLHQYPELSYLEYNTMEYIAEQLESIGIPYEKGIAKTGVIGIIYGKHHAKDQACIGLRADMDALPITEANDCSYVSKKPGVMHACGHDAHTAILLGAAEILWNLRDELPHPIKLIFQPGEEKNPGGASLMMQAGCLTNPPVFKMYGLHVDPDLPTGVVGTKAGMFMASCDEIYIDIIGKGGHGARPHKAIDSILIGAEIVTSLQQIISRKCDPNVPSVLSFGHFEALGATNIIPERVHIKGTFRTMDEQWRSTALQLIERQISLTAEAHGAKAKITISKGYPFLKNDETLTQDFIRNARAWMGSTQVIENMEMRMGSEDFAYYAQELPVCFFRIGVKAKGVIESHALHTPLFDIDHEALKIGVQLMVMNGL